MPLINTSLLVRLLSTAWRQLDLVTAEAPLSLQRGFSLASGTGNGQVDLLWTDTRTIVASGTDDLDLAGGGLTDVFGQAVSFARIKAVLVFAAAANVNNVVIGNAAANGWIGPFGAATHTKAVKPGGFEAFGTSDAAAWPVTPGTGDILRLANSGAGSSVTFDIAILGCSA